MSSVYDVLVRRRDVRAEFSPEPLAEAGHDERWRD